MYYLYVLELAIFTSSRYFILIYSMFVLYLTLHSLVLAIFSLIRNFAPIPMYGEDETTRTIPT